MGRFDLAVAEYTSHPEDSLRVWFDGPARIPPGVHVRHIVAPPECSVQVNGISWAKGRWGLYVTLYNVSGIRPDDSVNLELWEKGATRQTISLKVTQPPNVTVSDGRQQISAQMRPSPCQ